MKTKSQNTKSAPGLRVQSSNHQETPAAVSAPNATDAKTSRPPIDFKLRRFNKRLTTEKLLAVLEKEAPEFYQLAEVVGQWVWIQFNGKQPVEITATLSELGFHWNYYRQLWQHPCGTHRVNPRQRYGSHFAATKAA